MSAKPAFIFSLPRSGSTLLQRIIGAHPSVTTVSEPWILLPLFYMRSGEGMYTEYDHKSYLDASADFANHLPNGERDFEKAAHSYAMSLYQKVASEDASVFLDKTPRYHLISDRITSIFEDAKFVFLWRNPISIVASLLNMKETRSWNIGQYEVDLYKGFRNLVDTYRNSKSTYSLKYENLVSSPEKEVRKVFEYLDLEYDKKVLKNFDRVELKGGFGDKKGTNKYNKINKETLEKWTETIKNPVRKKWVKSYIKWIGRKDLNLIGYDLDEMLHQVDQVPISLGQTLSDAWGILRCRIRPWVEPAILREKVQSIGSNKTRYVHS